MPNWTAKVEYDYLGLRSLTAAPQFVDDTWDVSRDINMLTVGIN
jgi:hypothetical protein